MKQLLIFCFTVLSFLKPLLAQQVKSKSENSNFFLLGISNFLEFHTKGFPENELEVKASRGYLSRDEDGQYYFRTVTPGAVAFTYYWKGKEIGKDLYSVEDFPRAVAYFGQINDEGQFSLGMIKAQAGIAVRIENFDINWTLPIKEYRMRIIRNKTVIFDGIFIDYVQFGKEQKEVIDRLISGDEILFSDIKYTMKTPNESATFYTSNPFIRIKNEILFPSCKRANAAPTNDCARSDEQNY